ncbi:hypothetical protein K501DRAFT_285945, partial [Backusella circina FSU 941]
MCRNEIRQPPLHPPHLTLKSPVRSPQMNPIQFKALLNLQTQSLIITFVETLAGATAT